MMTAQVTRWHSDDRPQRQELEDRLKEEELSFHSWSNSAGYRYDPHSHACTKVIYVVEGSMVFTLPDENGQIELDPGDRLELQSGVLHGALVGPQGVLCLEGHQGST